MNTAPVKLFLAPMEGVTDETFREVISGINLSPEINHLSLNFCVSEFIRVTTSLHPKRVFYRYVPELESLGRTRSGVPVLIQLLGGHAEPLAENAVRAIQLGAQGVDLNFGCPAKTVNRHDGGASLLKCPERLYNIAKAVRQAMPLKNSVSAKIRLGVESPSLLFENVKALEEAGVSWITVHCRTKDQGYRPPAHWEWIPRLKEISKTPFVVNGDIFTLDDFIRCQNATQADAFMIGRGALKNPFLFLQIREYLTYGKSMSRPWPLTQQLVFDLHSMAEKKINAAFAAARTKQWLKYLSLGFPEARFLFENTKVYRAHDFSKKLRDPSAFELALSNNSLHEKIKTDVHIKHYF
ncbi:MAG: tRNA-dihydrouridine synthase family protein [Bdellovibrionota bacterium]